MTTIYLRFTGRAEALSVLSSRLGWNPEESSTMGFLGASRFDICFLEDVGFPFSSSEFLVNLLWRGTEDPPDFGLFSISPETPNCRFFDD